MSGEPSSIGIDIGGTHLRAARVDGEGRILARARAASSPDPAVVLDRIEALVAEIDDASVAGIGIGVPGRVDFEARRVLSGGYVDLSATPLAERLEARFKHPVVIDNDASMALLGEAAVGAARGARHVVMLTIGTGIGGAILEGGRLVRARGTAGQLGHVSIDPKGLHCVCGKRGCVETVSSGTALGRHIKDAGLPAETTAAELLARQEAGEPVATSVLSAWAMPLRIAIDSLVASLDPEIVVLGGGLGHAAAAALASQPTDPSWYEAPVSPARLGDDAGVIGAARAARAAMPERSGSKRIVLVNGVPASGKSGVAASLGHALGWPVITLDTIKNPFLEEIEAVDRPFNRKLGRASLKAMFAIVRDAPAGTRFILDAWFGFQPRELIDALLAEAGVDAAAEIWCTAPPVLIGERYGRRARLRPPGHPGVEYVPELVALAERARPLGLTEMIEVDTTRAFDVEPIRQWLLRPSQAAWPASA
ncbi:transcriptional regulator [Aureimonas sp. Leaf454]|uniref:ROK family protein n=1 Tax=Aureimonas sp. Leaf454 TaxID=1736381 RepID=UPI0006F1F0D3|nr:ROK family protein [Aureimonas sp. Leaf454]KQT51955.1 transcriptional regulator [Aureimonas sp. Leaf454]